MAIGCQTRTGIWYEAASGVTSALMDGDSYQGTRSFSAAATRSALLPRLPGCPSPGRSRPSGPRRDAVGTRSGTRRLECAAFARVRHRVPVRAAESRERRAIEPHLHAKTGQALPLGLTTFPFTWRERSMGMRSGASRAAREADRAYPGSTSTRRRRSSSRRKEIEGHRDHVLRRHEVRPGAPLIRRLDSLSGSGDHPDPHVSRDVHRGPLAVPVRQVQALAEAVPDGLVLDAESQAGDRVPFSSTTRTSSRLRSGAGRSSRPSARRSRTKGDPRSTRPGRTCMRKRKPFPSAPRFPPRSCRPPR